ncbi:carbonic anhydrase [Hoyosella subflava]|uniref:carbonic anhydrase n=1 Tax=Hoyosella subflava (strain DSM 45089 / JCM 17490 / NBRC 109087 / DQS3-9A1) TaxID=443218 RepID=F6EGY2_HOYSD|nr:carbonic anhydrase [Hoyosella subflava]AEF38806.1 Carbonic anhydrase [Hoyosella subflava DQS3-9A1]
MPSSNPVSAWKALKEGNERFVSGKPLHPSQGIDDRAKLVDAQHPTAIIFGCADSRVAAEIIFDQGLGQMFVIRTAGHVVDSAVLGSIEYGVAVLNVPLIVVLGHDKCGAVAAALSALDGGDMPDGFVRDIVERVTPSLLRARQAGMTTVDEFEAQHVRETSKLLTGRSLVLAERIADGRCAIVGATYNLAEGQIRLRTVVGDVGDAGEVD